ncbi:bifunctional 2-C-methyl-D-erythritol 4-phosphate cytidylyltransferase/2-C-methyl-D-erythritol 2,4-cyclodiphosphate synthase [Celeribacter sp.]|uniref:bifunctional 2-C-methyl-D-erythritol 4-phosphate cytidylyltransferase/2-C-methyl-D-erythritol 2,4-cyclodiphosphate synthase n=1 Tax=Celeribacter sp. TaxID=1890673 RepID=UPI003A8CEECE
MTCAALIVAAGRGTRIGGETPKQWRPLGAARVIDHAIAAFTGHVETLVVVHHPQDADLAEDLRTTYPDLILVAGGATRAASVRAGLAALEGSAVEKVLIHDAARALTPPEVIQGVIDALAHGPAAAPALPVVDALWRGDGDMVVGTASREGLYRAQTPQGFARDTITAAHAAFDGEAADDVEVARAFGLPATITKGHEDNFKITHAEDFARAEATLAARVSTGDRPMNIRLGNGYDVHRFGEGDHVWLCGVKIPHGRGLQGHSDADVGMHALTDALYGALAEGDIGRHFPPTDPQWKGAESHIFLRHAMERVRARGFELSNCDVTLICERPKIGPHAEAMQQVLAEIMGVEAGRVSVKATTSERLGFTGREEGIAAIATAALQSRA